MAVYLLHFTRPLQSRSGRQVKQASHYMGWSSDLAKRIHEHRAGLRSASRLMQVIHEQGIGFVVAKVWPDGDRALERKLKNRKKHSRLCPICRQELSNPQLPGLEE